MKKLHLALQYLCVASGVLALPFSAQMSRNAARILNPELEDILKGNPMPALTDLFITRQAQSPEILIGAFVAAAMLGALAIFCTRFGETDSGRITGLLLIVAVGYTSGLMLLGSTLIAFAMPFITISGR